MKAIRVFLKQHMRGSQLLHMFGLGGGRNVQLIPLFVVLPIKIFIWSSFRASKSFGLAFRKLLSLSDRNTFTEPLLAMSSLIGIMQMLVFRKWAISKCQTCKKNTITFLNSYLTTSWPKKPIPVAETDFSYFKRLYEGNESIFGCRSLAFMRQQSWHMESKIFPLVHS